MKNYQLKLNKKIIMILINEKLFLMTTEII